MMRVKEALTVVGFSLLVLLLLWAWDSKQARKAERRAARAAQKAAETQPVKQPCPDVVTWTKDGADDRLKF